MDQWCTYLEMFTLTIQQCLNHLKEGIGGVPLCEHWLIEFRVHNVLRTP